MKQHHVYLSVKVLEINSRNARAPSSVREQETKVTENLTSLFISFVHELQSDSYGRQFLKKRLIEMWRRLHAREEHKDVGGRAWFFYRNRGGLVTANGTPGHSL